MKLPIIEYAVTLAGAPLATVQDEVLAVRFMRRLEEAASEGVTLVGALGVVSIKREVEVATMAEVNVRTLDTAALALAYDDAQVQKAAIAEVADAVVRAVP